MQDHIDGLAAELGKSMKRELQECGALCQEQFAELCSQLAERKAQITAKTDAYQKVPVCPDKRVMPRQLGSSIIVKCSCLPWTAEQAHHSQLHA